MVLRMCVYWGNMTRGGLRWWMHGKKQKTGMLHIL